MTGGTSGIGRSLLPFLIESGFEVHFVGRSEAKGRAIEAELNAEHGPVSHFIRLDLSELRATRDFAVAFRQEHPELHLLANVAGVMLPTRELSSEGIEKTFAIAHLSSVVLSRELLPSLERAAPSRIVNVAGGPSQLLEPRLDFDNLNLDEGYSLMRAALDAVHAKTVWTQILADELSERGVDVNCFHPGTVKGGLFRNMRFPMSALFGFMRFFMTDTCKSGIHVSTAAELEGVTGQLFVGHEARPLSFAPNYQARLREKTDELLAPLL